MNISQAILSLQPTAEFVTRNNTDIEWHSTDITQPSQADIATEVTRLQAEYDSLAYARSRKSEYDKLNQFELISEDAINGTTNHKDTILAIKAKYPKPV